ncbi:hypothetical protein U1P98_17550 [Lysinibacillus irui]|uniref:Uncharacterized protein n=1 Tax=Lysinibacillus irui TaxID=2998077 RepID=A0ABU5NPY6_9BACI|nr:hypothetical protein [Lysinibacillus irui]MEA0552192.1 hypothetical protein [Lysinibacillus irui]MEA0978117.1 hypothetical protein [Lysinibacillus irui]MEA1044271.1 hypothetical protein [Lysinibacillus irui]
MSELNILLICQLGMGLFWIITYILVIYKGWRDKQYGMPMAAICANISWEFIFAFFYPQNDLQRFITLIWFLLDIFILMQFLRYAPNEYRRMLSKKLLYFSFLLTLVFSMLTILGLVHEFHDYEGKYAAFFQNLMMSGLFIALLLQRGNLAGQSMAIAICKMLGTLFASVGFYLYFRTPLITIISVATLFYDWLYILLIYRWQKQKPKL